MRKLLGLFSVCALVGVAAGVNGAGATPPSGQSSSTEYGRAQQVDDAKVVVPTGHDVLSSTYTVAPGGDTGWRTGPGTTALAVTKGALKVEQAEGCAEPGPSGREPRRPCAGPVPAPQRRAGTGGTAGQLHQAPSGAAAPLGTAPADRHRPAPGSPPPPSERGLQSPSRSGATSSPYFRQAHGGHGGGDG